MSPHRRPFEKVIKRGAEAVIYLGKYAGRSAVVKERTPKTYRNRKLDEMLRMGRTTHEALMTVRARTAGVRTPIIYDVDRRRARIIMEHIPGQTLSERSDLQDGILTEVGRCIGALHRAGIVHGDPTTSNMIYHRGGICLLDFGLSACTEDIEDFGVDILMFERGVTAVRPELGGRMPEMRRAYADSFPSALEVFRRVKDIKSRRRYA